MARLAVITGDLIGSMQVADPDAFRARLKQLLERAHEKYGAVTNLYRGDGFQLALAGKVNAFEVAVVLRTGLIARGPDTRSPDRGERWDARLAIAFGNGRLSSRNQNSPAYVDSGRALDTMKEAHLCVAAGDEFLRLASGVATDFVDATLNQLSPAEAEVLYYYFLDRGSHQSIADRMGKKRPTVTQALHRAGYSLLDRYVRDMDALMRLSGEAGKGGNKQ